MSKYEIRDVVSDYGIYRDGELLLILNSRSNAEYIKAILEHEERHPNAGVPYSPEVADMSDEECLAVFKLCCCSDENNCERCPLHDEAFCFQGIDRRMLKIAERAVESRAATVKAVPVYEQGEGISCECQTDATACCACVSMHCDKCHGHRKNRFIQGRFCSKCGRPLKAELSRNYVPKSEVDKLEYTLLGVMHSVDKWLDGEELEQDEVNRAATMREKTLRIIENAKIEVAREFIKACDSMLSLVCEMTGLEMTFFGKYAKLKHKYKEGKTDENISD